MSYKKFKKQTDNFMTPFIFAYTSVANIQGVHIEDASSYFLSSYLENLFNRNFSIDTYTIIDDLNMSESVSIDKKHAPKTIYTSEFGDRVIEYVTNIFFITR